MEDDAQRVRALEAEVNRLQAEVNRLQAEQPLWGIVNGLMAARQGGDATAYAQAVARNRARTRRPGYLRRIQ